MACQSSIVIEAGNCERVAKEFGAIKCVFVPSGVGGSNHRGGIEHRSGIEDRGGSGSRQDFPTEKGSPHHGDADAQSSS